jgi:hypothetical protein
LQNIIFTIKIISDNIFLFSINESKIMKSKKVLILGATGAMGKYLVPKLVAKNYIVDAVSLEDYEQGSPLISRINPHWLLLETKIHLYSIFLNFLPLRQNQ